MTDEVALWKQPYHYWRRQVIKAEGSAVEHTANIEPVIFAKLDRAEILPPALRVTWQDVTIYLSNTQETHLAAELIVSLRRPC